MIRLKELREDLDLIQKDISDYLEIDQSNYSKYELEKVNIPIEHLIKLAIFYNTSIDYILYITDIKEPYARSVVVEQNLYKHPKKVVARKKKTEEDKEKEKELVGTH